ncbi:MAG: RNA polymerase subunit sigma-70 [Acidobacteria bacterium]|nr:RNA polymerase subunit sigma-70 [Acidobacteriota bacterium]
MNASMEITGLLERWNRGDAGAADELLPLVYEELLRQARGYMRGERPGHTLNGTALVHEVVLRMLDQNAIAWRNRGHFFGMAARLMRHVLVDHARAVAAGKRGRDPVRLELTEAMALAPELSEELLAVDLALERFSRIDPLKARIVELRYFWGMSIDEAAEALHVSRDTVKRSWAVARMWLHRECSLTPRETL